jgi:hypothetical protein
MCENKEALLAKNLRQLAKQIDEPESTAGLITQAEIIERRIGPKNNKSTCLYTCLYNGNLPWASPHRPRLIGDGECCAPA